MEEFDLKWIDSGKEDSSLWISLGFSSKLKEEDVLHVVCATEVDEQDRKLGMNSIYLERIDQDLCCYNGSPKIIVGKNTIEIHMNRKGRKELKFRSGVRFRFSKKLSTRLLCISK